jgi:gluconolactonase
MKNLIIILVLLLAALSPGAAQYAGLEKIIMSGAQVQKLADGFLFTEGPSADKEGNIYFTDQPNDRIMIWNIRSGISVFMEPCGRSNGLAFDNYGNLWSCADEKNEIWKIAPDRKIEIITAGYEGKLFNGPNDLWITPGGGIYFTDPFYKRAWWNHTDMPQDKQCVYYLQPDLKTVIRVAEDLKQPNGIVGSPDGKKLFVADIRDNKTWSYTINTNGTLSDKVPFCEMGSDGMTIDANGNIYLTGKGVTIFDKTGKRLGNIPIEESWTANVCFGGNDLKTLFITSSKGLYCIRLRIKGTKG